jgi:hypothetical protein
LAISDVDDTHWKTDGFLWIVVLKLQEIGYQLLAFHEMDFGG